MRVLRNTQKEAIEMKVPVALFALSTLGLLVTAHGAPNTLVAEPPNPFPGDAWVFKSFQGATQVRKFLKEENGFLVYEVVHTSPGGKPTPYTFLLTKNLSIVKVVRGDGVEHRRFEPHALGLQFPLKVGNKWQEKAQRFDQGRPGPLFLGSFKAIHVEDLTVAAGKFPSFRVDAETYPENDRSKIFRVTNWYSPEANAIVKIWEKAPDGSESTFELVEYRPAPQRAPR
jgi:hypothetical protein